MKMIRQDSTVKTVWWSWIVNHFLNNDGDNNNDDDDDGDDYLITIIDQSLFNFHPSKTSIRSDVMKVEMCFIQLSADDIVSECVVFNFHWIVSECVVFNFRWYSIDVLCSTFSGSGWYSIWKWKCCVQLSADDNCYSIWMCCVQLSADDIYIIL